MTDCASIEVGKLIGTGEASSFAKAVRQAGKDFQTKGRTACLPGSCGQLGGKCSFKLSENSVSIDVRVVGTSTDPQYWVEITGTGTCKCGG